MRLSLAFFALCLLSSGHGQGIEDPIPFQPIVLPEIPRLSMGDGTSRSSEGKEKPAGSGELTPLSVKSTKLIYYRKKTGQGTLSVTSAVDCIVKLIDLQSGRLAGMVAMPANRAFVFPVPPSMYGIVYAEGPGLRPDGSFDARWFGKISEIDMTTPGQRTRVVLSIDEGKAKPTDLSTWNRFNPPGSATVSLD